MSTVEPLLELGEVQGLREPLQVIDHAGRQTGERYPDDLSASEHAAMLRAMIVTRRLDTEFVNLQRQGQLALFPSCQGQEAAQVGTTSALRSTDWLFPQYRELGAFVVREIPPEAIGLMWRGALHGGVDMVESCCAPMSIPIGTHALHAVGYAMGAQLDGDDTVGVAFIGDGAMSEGDVHEALNIAAVFNAPCIFVVQNNQWAISVPTNQQMRSRTIAQRASAYAMTGVRCDGNDVLASYLAMQDAIERARSGGGPTLIEAVTYRMNSHTTSDDASRYRDPDEVEHWSRLDPIDRYTKHLIARQLWSPDDQTLAERAGEEAAMRLRDSVFDAADPDPLTLFDNVLSRRSPELDRQRSLMAEELSHGK